jgi:hypothetical protein
MLIWSRKPYDFKKKKVFKLDGIAMKILPESSYYLSQNKINA